MALKPADQQFLQGIGQDLQMRFVTNASWRSVDEEVLENGNKIHVVNDDSVTPVEISKQDLRDVSGRRIIRDSHLQDVAAELNQQPGVKAIVDLERGVVRAHATPVAEYVSSPMTPAQLRREAEAAARRQALDSEE